jgi:hypothetical protein
LAFAMLDYESAHGRLPPAVVYGKNGEPLYSWRVLIQPYLEQGELYNQFHLDEPWDSPHNIQLLPKMPLSYAAPPRKMSKLPPYHTICHVFVGKGTAFEGRAGLNLKKDFPNGASNTLAIVEAGKPVPWTKPEELEYDPDGPLPDLTGLFKDGFRACRLFGGSEFIPKDTSEADLRALITRNGGENPWTRK